MSEPVVLFVGDIDPDDGEGMCRVRVATTGEDRVVRVELVNSAGRWTEAAPFYVADVAAHLARELHARDEALKAYFKARKHREETARALRVAEGRYNRAARDGKETVEQYREASDALEADSMALQTERAAEARLLALLPADEAAEATKEVL